MKRIAIILFLSLAVVLLVASLIIYNNITDSKIETGGEARELIIPTGATYEDVFASIDSLVDIKNPDSFHWIANKKGYPEHVKAGRYLVEDGVTYLKFIDILRAGKQIPVNVTFNNIRTLNQLAGKIGGRIEADSASIMQFLDDESNYSDDGFKKETVIAVFIPNTYQFFWNTDAKGFYKRMLREYKSFWNTERVAAAKRVNLDPVEVATLASIVDDEVAKAEEKPVIAGVYLNRLRIGMPLQACPTIRFALNDYTITRVLNKHLVIESPYNTYKHKGLPPGPVGCPSVEGIDAVLNAKQHDYLFFAAKSDFSGYHNFSRTLSEHNRYAAQYQRELNRLRIFR